MKVLISGASVAGPSAALWLGRAGHDVTVVEIAPALRQGGYAVDFRGEVFTTVLERMGVLDELRSLQTGGNAMRFVDESGRKLMRLPAEFAGGELEVLRADLSRVLYEHSRAHATYRFGDSIAALHEHAAGVDVRFESGIEDTYDLVVGADGMHSVVRRLVWPQEQVVERHLNYYVAGWEVPNTLGISGDSLMYNVPGKLASVGADRRDPGLAGTLFLFKSPVLQYDRRDVDQQKAIIRQQFDGLGWHVPELLNGLPAATELYFDSISRVRVDRWSTERIVLLGDAGYGATFGALGTGTAVVGAYVLAGELARADFRTAFDRYEAALRKSVSTTQDGSRAGSFLAPASRFGIVARNKMLDRPFFLNQMLKMAQNMSELIELPPYSVKEGHFVQE
ncbi:2-polyprenyl-6-methoxyphenol hydroxylase-like FAD-dependent oxidoreductase [Kribbella aluminosa]|uniref:2-polyprenyl-6-methoxyphenol hydroxylase-like FAD-dependent oxidoreductase n=1 Tax=Kribbella aluminosa TaxID=416017 RepID=A0ABS4UME8_9ACTN|nr:FAD-dependent monooxygenase [Kribbella aluminosa]MBP2352804.1 2-polyprenyl-6-methoxyphenol hydroxylase-like FAD-dependent oxidoreductase [Kribbella aluminosa]